MSLEDCHCIVCLHIIILVNNFLLFSAFSLTEPKSLTSFTAQINGLSFTVQVASLKICEHILKQLYMTPDN